MTHVLLPYMVLALYGVMRKIDPSYLRAAEGLGARPFGAFRLVFLPLSLPGVRQWLRSRLHDVSRLLHHADPARDAQGHDDLAARSASRSRICWPGASPRRSRSSCSASTLVLLGIYNRFAGLDRLWG